MYVYRITLAKYATALFAPGTAGRWNSNGVKLIYTASSRSLACLENLVHRGHIALQSSQFNVLTIHIPDTIIIETVSLSMLPDDWSKDTNRLLTMRVGDSWVATVNSCILQVPSVIINSESNFLINPAHPDFSKISIESISDFAFDERLKQ